MQYRMKEKLWSFADKYNIEDASGNPVYYVDGKAFSFGKKLSFCDISGKELAFISQHVFSFVKHFDVYRQGELFAEITKDLAFFKQSFTVDVPGPNDYSVEGKFWTYEYEFKRKNQTVASVSKSYFSWADAYGIDIQEGEDDIMILATAVVIDLVCHENR